jgi:very-short-patch-repair endonuclease
LDRHAAIALLDQLTAIPTHEHDVPPVLVKGPHAEYQTESEAEDRFARILQERDFPLPPKSQYRVELPGGSFTVADYAYPDEKVLIFIDGMSKSLHGDPNQQRKDKLQRAKAKMLGYQVIALSAEDLKDETALALVLDELTVYLGWEG